LQRDNYLCQRCYSKGLLTPADIVHHIQHLSKEPDRALDEDNLISVCTTCHNQLHPEKGKRVDVQRVRRARVMVVKSNEESL
jgi:5-methylcytosine-specific restriction enzyme A